MMDRILKLTLLGVLLGVSAACAVEEAKTEKHEMPPPYVGSAELQKLKSLVGRWEGPSPDMPDGKIILDYKVTSNGSAVAETILPGTPMEMISVYRDNKDGKLSMIHYCAMANQPELVLQNPGSEKMILDLNPDSIKPGEPHMHRLEMLIKDSNHVEQTWQCYPDGKTAKEQTSVLTRVV
jgi:hypothetical protein